MVDHILVQKSRDVADTSFGIYSSIHQSINLFDYAIDFVKRIRRMLRYERNLMCHLLISIFSRLPHGFLYN